jgi:hypothetical protein
MKAVILAAALFGLTVTAVQAQNAATPTPMELAGGGRHSQQQKHLKPPPPPKADEKAYSSAIKGIPDKPYDAWHGVR